MRLDVGREYDRTVDGAQVFKFTKVFGSIDDSKGTLLVAASARVSRGDLIEGCCTSVDPVSTGGGRLTDLVLPVMVDLSVAVPCSIAGSAELGAGLSSEDKSAIARGGRTGYG